MEDDGELVLLEAKIFVPVLHICPNITLLLLLQNIRIVNYFQIISISTSTKILNVDLRLMVMSR